jgi:RimJ/RimL family protein N-acetyltransferase
MLASEIDRRVHLYLERDLGVSFQSFPRAGIDVREGPKHTDVRGNRLSILGIGDGALAVATPDVAAAVSPVLSTLTVNELFSPLGLSELGRTLRPQHAPSLSHEWDYVVTDPSEFRPADTAHVAVPLRKENIPPEQFELRMSERRCPAEAEQDDFVWAFACYHGDPDTAAALGAFGPHCASIARVIWMGREVASFAVQTEEAYRGRGYALAVVSAATRFVLAQGAVAIYSSDATNLPSLRIPRRLGYQFAWQTISA